MLGDNNDAMSDKKKRPKKESASSTATKKTPKSSTPTAADLRTQRSITSFFSKTPVPAKNTAGEASQSLNDASSPAPAVSKAAKLKKDKGLQDNGQDGNVDAMAEDSDDAGSKPALAKSRKRNMIMDSDDDDDEEIDGDDTETKRQESDIMMDDDDSDAKKKSSKKRKSTAELLKTPAKRRLDSFLSSGLATTPSGGSTMDPKTPASASSARTSFTTPGSAWSTKKKEKAENFKERNEARYSWLLDVKDADGKRPGDEDYDPNTLHVPKEAWHKFTPFEKQFWEIKSKHWSTVVFFKKGKFYEVYERDADIAHQEFDWKLTDRTNMRMCGAPESSFESWAAKFVARGYKVARVDQVETMIGKEIREKNQASAKKEDKIIRRELTTILTSGTLVDGELISSDSSVYCMSIKEEVTGDLQPPRFGICFVDTSTAEFRISSFEDDVDRSKFETIVLQLKPRELVIEKGCLSSRTMRIIKNSLSNAEISYRLPEREFWDADTTLIELRRAGYFAKAAATGDENAVTDEDDVMASNGEVKLPGALEAYISNKVVLSAVGGLISYLRMLKLDKELVSVGNFAQYNPMSHSDTLVLDGKTLFNLEIFENTSDGSESGSLFKLINHCQTPFGKRMLKRWVCHPLRDISAINSRLDAVDDILNLRETWDDLSNCFKKLPDLERIISRIHAGNCKVKDFVGTLAAFTQILNLVQETCLLTESFKSSRLAEIFCNGFPSGLRNHLEFFAKAFDHKESVKEGVININSGYDSVYDNAQVNFEEVEAEFQKYLRQQEIELGCKLTYKDLGKDLWQLEVPATKIKNVPRSWEVVSKTKNVIRYWTPQIKDMTQRFLEVREHRNDALKDVKLRLYGRFDESYVDWLKVVRSLAELDCLMSLAKCRTSMGTPMCRPEFLDGKAGVLHVEELRHPCIVSQSGKDFIPNDTTLGGVETPRMMLLTGPNMGGKSTLLRQNCIAVIMAQIGCYVPANVCRLTPFDRIFTRIGASDNILAGQSTFMVELAETSRILKEATPMSLVVVDELGRGTSTFDGYAIAFSVMHYLTTRVRCLGLFSTHYDMLTKEFEDNSLVSLNFMNFVSSEESREVTFLYKLTKGVSPKSFGMNVASMAGVPVEIVDRAEEIAAKFELDLKLNRVRDVDSQLKMSRHADFGALFKGRSLDAGVLMATLRSF